MGSPWIFWCFKRLQAKTNVDLGVLDVGLKIVEILQLEALYAALVP